MPYEIQAIDVHLVAVVRDRRELIWEVFLLDSRLDDARKPVG
jgi:hypothetical protein